MKLELEVSVPIETYETKIEYFEYEDKKFFQAYVEYIAEATNIGLSSEKDLIDGISRDLFFRPNHQVFAIRILNILEKEKYIERKNGTLLITDLGHELRKTGKFRARYEDVFSIEVIRDHPIIGNQIVNVTQLSVDRSNNLKKIINEDNKDGKEEHNKSKGLKEIKLGSLENKNFQLIDGKTIFIQSIGKKGKKLKNKKNYTLKLSLDQNAEVLELKSKGNQIDYSDLLKKEFPEIKFLEVLTSLFRNYGFVYDNGKVHLNTLQYENSPSRRSLTLNFRQGFAFDAPQLKFKSKFVTFKKTSIPEVSCIPLDQACAEEWANSMLQLLISAYVDEEEYNELKSKTAAKFEEFSFSVSLPYYQEACAKWNLDTSNELFWFLQAPLDLNLEVVE